MWTVIGAGHRHRTACALTGLLLAGALLATPARAAAQQAYVAARGSAAGILHQRLEGAGALDHGAGLGLSGGVRIGPYFALGLDWDVTFHDSQIEPDNPSATTLHLHTLVGSFQVLLPLDKVEPFFEIGVGYALAAVTEHSAPRAHDLRLAAGGPVVALGGGVGYRLGPSFSLGARLLYRGAGLGELAAGHGGGDNFVGALAVNLYGRLSF